MIIEQIAEHNIDELAKLMLELWPECNLEEEYSNCTRMLNLKNETCFLVKQQDQYIAFIQLSIRTEHVEGSTSSPVVYMEGIYVQPDHQKAGIGKKLVAIGEEWGKENGCAQFASDAELHNQDSISFHSKVGFEEVNRTVSFIKNINQ